MIKTKNYFLVWLEIMLPVMTMKHYSKFVVNYLVQLLNIHNITETTQIKKPVVDLVTLKTVQDAVFVLSTQMNKEYARYWTSQLLTTVEELHLKPARFLPLVEALNYIENFELYTWPYTCLLALFKAGG